MNCGHRHRYQRERRATTEMTKGEVCRDEAKQPEMVQMKRDDSLTEPRKPEISLDFSTSSGRSPPTSSDLRAS